MTDSDRERAADTSAEGDAPGGGTGPAEAARETQAQPAAASAFPADPSVANPNRADGRPEEALAAFSEGLGPRAGLANPAGDAPLPGKKRRRGGNWLDDLKAIFWLLLAVLVFHSCVAKPFYIPSESMMPGLLKGDRLVVSKYPYGWSWVSPSFHIFPHWQGRIWGAMPRRGDIVIVTPPGGNADYIKRVIGLPGDTVEVVAGEVVLNGRRLRREARDPTNFPIDANLPCGNDDPRDPYSRRFRFRDGDGRWYCRMPVFREYIPDEDGRLRSYDTIDTGYIRGVDDYAATPVPPGHVFLMGDNRDDSADSRVDLEHNGLGGPVPWENIGGRAEFITFSLDGSSSYWNPISWFTALRGGRAGTSLHPADSPPR